ncbi:ATP-binding protein [Krasilnikovia sp. MM14-A1004]|uniref:ATP-binding protein n=1 Tax=Krasilnikovia sp. MM14-A1004 TaxID=3373541 RepID=UPI00399D13A0
MTASHEVVGLPDPGRASTLDELIECLQRLKAWAGNPSYEVITRRVNADRPAWDAVGKTTVVDCFRLGRRRIDDELVASVVAALAVDAGFVAQWRRALRAINGEVQAAAQVRVQDVLPQELSGFTGRESEIGRIRQRIGTAGGAVVISALAGMAGAGKTQLALRTAHLLLRDEPFDQVLFVNLRGFHPDPAQPPAEPAAVLDGFLRLLGVSGQQIPHRLEDRVALYRQRLADRRALVVLDNAADERQVRPLLPGLPTCVTLVTSRRDLTELPQAVRVTVDTFTADESLLFLRQAAAIPAGDDPRAASRIAERCGRLPLALALMAGHMRAKEGWTLTDHADWLDERHQDHRLDSAVELALDVSYRNLPAEERELLRLVAQHPGQDMDLGAVAALSGAGIEAAERRLRSLSSHHLIQPVGADRYALHDLVRTYAVARACDEDRRADRRRALTRLFDYYLATAVVATRRLDPGKAGSRIWIPESPVALPTLGDPITWLDTERVNLVAVAVHAAEHDWSAHAVSLSAVLNRYLTTRGHHLEARTVHGRAARAAQRAHDVSGQAAATVLLAATDLHRGRYQAAIGVLERARGLFREAGDVPGEADALNNLGIAEMRLGRYRDAAAYLHEALELHRRGGGGIGQIQVLTNLACAEADLGQHAAAIAHCEEGLALARDRGDLMGEAILLCNLGGSEARLGRYERAEEHLTRSVALARELRNVIFEASALDNMGVLHTRRGEAGRAIDLHRRAIALYQQLGHRYGESCARNGLGEAAAADGRCDAAITEHTAAYALASEPDAVDLEQQARARTGLGAAHHALGNRDESRHHYESARDIWAGLDPSKADLISATLEAMRDQPTGL